MRLEGDMQGGAAHRLAIASRFADHLASGSAVFATGAALASELPYTVAGGQARQITGFNRWMLLQVMHDRRWLDPRFFTAAQVDAAGWHLKNGSEPVALQIARVTDEHGQALATPLVDRVAVFNAGAISGAPAFQPSVSLSLEAGEAAMMAAGFEPGRNVLASLVDWLDVQHRELASLGPAGDALARAMSTSLVANQLHGVHSPIAMASLQLPIGERGLDVAEAIRAAPALFFEAVRISELVAGQTISRVRLAEHELAAERELRRSQLRMPGPALAEREQTPTQTDDAPMEPNRSSRPVRPSDNSPLRDAARPAYAARLEDMFAERAAVLAVPFKEKDRAHSMGAVYYPPRRVWFVPKGVDVAQFREWNPAEHCLGPVAADREVVEAFRKDMEAMGLDAPQEILADGKWHNVRALANKGANKSGAYLLSLAGGRDGTPVGSINNKFSGESRAWSFDGALMTPEQKARLRADAVRRAEIADREAKAAQDAAAQHAAKIVTLSEPAGDHPYLRKKGISSSGARAIAGKTLLEFPEFVGENGKSAIRADRSYLIIPMRSASGEIRAVQAISEDGKVKSFMRGAQKKGTMAVLGAPSFDALCDLIASESGPATEVAFVEGFATGASLRRGTGMPVVVCFDAGNVEAVAAVAARQLPANARAVFAVDNDQFHVEKALGYLANTLGVNPNSQRGSVVEVLSSASSSRLVSLGDAIADGDWHQAPQGRYRMSLEREPDSTEVRAISIEAVATGTDKNSRANFNNRGLEVGRTALAMFAERGMPAFVLVPEFKQLAGHPTDWNDLEREEGMKAVASQVLTPLGRAPAPQQGQGHSRAAVARAGAGTER